MLLRCLPLAIDGPRSFIKKLSLLQTAMSKSMPTYMATTTNDNIMATWLHLSVMNWPRLKETALHVLFLPWHCSNGCLSWQYLITDLLKNCGINGLKNLSISREAEGYIGMAQKSVWKISELRLFKLKRGAMLTIQTQTEKLNKAKKLQEDSSCNW